eukprot:3291701-Prymnesium_polylepis.2
MNGARIPVRQAWDHMSAVCFLTARTIHDEFGGTVPIGLISSNWGGTPVQSWERDTGTLYNSSAPRTLELGPAWVASEPTCLRLRQ